jgi:hypothetical protein
LRRRNAAWATIKEAHAEGVFKIPDCSRNCWLGGCKVLRRLVHAAGLNHGHENAHIVQLEAAFNALDLIHDGTPYIKVDMTQSDNSITSSRRRAVSLQPCQLSSRVR